MTRHYVVRALEADLDVAQALNDRGEVVGGRWSPAGRRAVKCSPGDCRDIGSLGGSYSMAHGVNNQGEVVGRALTSGDHASHGFLATEATLVDLNRCIVPGQGWEILDAMDINDRGQILCLASRAGRDHLVILEPDTCVQER